jgi:hypothetical protein
VQVNDIWDMLGAMIFLALVAVILTKKNTAKDVKAAGTSFTGALSAAEAG